MKIAVDTGAYAAGEAGIARYIGCTLDALRSIAPKRHQWLLYGRGAAPRGLAEGWPDAQVRTDGMPHHAGRIASLATSLPLWAWRDQPDVLWGPAHRLPLWVPRNTARVVTVHDLCWLRAPQTMRLASRALDAAFMPRALRQADRIIAVSQATADDLVNTFPWTAQRLTVVLEGASPLPSPEAAERLATLGIPMPYVLFVGTLEPRKNLPRLLEAFAAWRRATPDVPALVIAGGAGWGGESLAARCEALGLRDRVYLAGRVDDQRLATLYAHALFLAMPSLYEGFGLPLVEAMSFGTPVLTSRTAAMPEVAGRAGVLVDPCSTESILEGLRQLAQGAALRTALAREAPREAQRFSWNRCALATMAVLEEAAAQRHRD